MPPRVSVVIPARDAGTTLPAALDALGAQRDAPPFEVLVADDASRDATRALAAAHPAVTRVVDTGGHGPGAARNVAVAASSGELVAFTDADCVPDPGWVGAIAAALEHAELVQGRVDPQRAPGPWDRTVSVQQLSPLFETANLALRRELFDRLGGFEPWLSPRRGKELGEDVWLGWRARRSGARIAFAPDARVVHAVFAGTPRTHVAERARLRYFPALAARIPELRGSFLHRRVFLTARSARFDLALAGVLAAAGTRRALPLVVALPYARCAWRGAGGRPRVAAVAVAADATGAAALLAGSLRERSLVV